MSIFTNKNVLIYGGGKGIGRAIALEFSHRGARVAIGDIDRGAAGEGKTAIEKSGGTAIALHCDVTSSESVTETAAEAEKSLGEVDIVVNNVGVILSGNPEDIPFTEWQRIVDLNLYPVLRSNDVFLPKMLARGSGHIINTASLAGLFPYGANRLPYVATKSAIVALSEALAIYTLPKGVNISCFCPGPTITQVSDGMKSWSDDATMSGPGEEFDLMTAEQAAIALALGIEEGKILIPAHKEAFTMLKKHANNPDQFVKDKIEAFSKGEMGLPIRARAT